MEDQIADPDKALAEAQGRSEEAGALTREALALCAHTLGPDHHNTRKVRENLRIFLADHPRTNTPD